MGLTAFLIVGITGVPYGTVMLAALMPALIYYGNLIIAVHLYAVSSDLSPSAYDLSEPKMSLRGEIMQYGHLVLAVALLVYLLIGRMPPGHAAVIAALFIVVAETLKQLLVYKKPGGRRSASSQSHPHWPLRRGEEWCSARGCNCRDWHSGRHDDHYGLRTKAIQPDAWCC